MEKEINTNLIFVKPEHYNQMLDLFVREQERKKEENTLYVKIVHVNDFVIFFLPVFCTFVSKWLHPPKASHLFTITQHITVNGVAETSYDVLCHSQAIAYAFTTCR